MGVEQRAAQDGTHRHADVAEDEQERDGRVPVPLVGEVHQDRHGGGDHGRVGEEADGHEHQQDPAVAGETAQDLDDGHPRDHAEDGRAPADGIRHLAAQERAKQVAHALDHHDVPGLDGGVAQPLGADDRDVRHDKDQADLGDQPYEAEVVDLLRESPVLREELHASSSPDPGEPF